MNALFNFPPSIVCFLGLLILTVIIASLFLPAILNDHNALHFWINQIALIGVLVTAIWSFLMYPDKEVVFLSGHFIWSPLTALLSISLLMLSLPIIVYSKEGLYQEEGHIQDYYILNLIALLGGVAALTAGSIFSFYLGIEIMSLASYGLVGFASKDALRIEATMKYIIMGIVSSVLLLYGLCLLYFTGADLSLTSLSIINLPPSTLTQISACLLLAGFLFKLGAAPFHFWVPDVYQTTSISSTLFLSTIAKFTAIGIGLRLFLHYLSYLTIHHRLLILMIGLLSLVCGNLMALRQQNVRRLLAYSSIAHMGFIVIGYALPSIYYPITLFYGFNYCFMTSLLLGVVIHLSHAGLTINNLDDLKGLNVRHPIASFIILLVMSSMAGIPPLSGFFGKLGILYSLLKETFYTTAAIALLGTVIGSYYYLTIIKRVYFEVSQNKPQTLSINWLGSSPIMLAVSTCLLVLISLFPNQLMNIMNHTIHYDLLALKCH